MNIYSLKKEKHKLSLRYLIVIPSSLFLLFFFLRFEQITDLHLWYLLPTWILLAHLSCAVSNLITDRSFRASRHLFRSTFLIYGKRTSVVHFQSAFLTSLLEETIFRYVLLNLLLDRLGHNFLAVVLTSVAFAVIHLVFNRGSRRLLPCLDLFLFSIAVSVLNVVTASFYPALIIHGMRNYILRVLLIRRDEQDLSSGGGIV